jgi:hypothetical protein
MSGEKSVHNGGAPITCRDVPPAEWAHARQALIRYFQHRLHAENSEDLAHDVLAAMWSRPDIRFESKDFLRMCYGFARRVRLAATRTGQRAPLPLEELAIEAIQSEAHGLCGVEVDVYLEELLRIGSEVLAESDWQLLQSRTKDNAPAPAGSAEGNRMRVRLHRARKKLAAALRPRKR